MSALGDVSDKSNVQVLVQTSVDELGPLDVMVANAGIASVKPILEVTEADLKHMFQTNIYSVFYCDSIAARQFIKQGNGGKIINACRSVCIPFVLLRHINSFAATPASSPTDPFRCYPIIARRRRLYEASRKLLLSNLHLTRSPPTHTPQVWLTRTCGTSSTKV